MEFACRVGCVVLFVAIWTGDAFGQKAYPKRRVYDNVTQTGPLDFVLLGPGWDGPGLGSSSLRFHFLNDNTAPEFPGDSEQDVLREALNLWASVAEIDWTEVATPAEPESIDFEWSPIDGPGGTLAFSAPPPPVFFDPEAGDITYDSDEDWIAGFDPFAGIAQLPVAIHEIGHSIGLGHTSDERSIMFATYAGGSLAALSSDDVAGVRSLYRPRFPEFAARVRGRHSAMGDVIIRVGVRDRLRGPTLWERDVHLRFGGQNNDFDYVEIDLSAGRALLDGSNDWFVSVQDVEAGDEGTLDEFEIRINDCVFSSPEVPLAIRDNDTATAFILDLEDISGCPPVHDRCAEAAEIAGLPFSDTVISTSGATTDADDPVVSCGSSEPSQQSHSVWYRYVPVRDGTLRIDTEGSGFPAIISVYTGMCGSLSEAACQRGEPPPRRGLPSEPARLDEVPVVANEPVYIEITAAGTAEGGLLVLHVAENLPGDDCQQPVEIIGFAFSDTQDTTSATSDPLDPIVCVPAGATNWYRYIPPGDGVVDLDTAGSDYDTVLAVLTGECESLTSIACNDDTFTLQAALDGVPVRRGEPVRIMVAAFGGDFGGTLELQLRFAPACFDAPEQAVAPEPIHNAGDLSIDNDLAWSVGLCGEGNNELPNGGFEAGNFSQWSVQTGPGQELTPWSVSRRGTASGWFENGFPAECDWFAQNGFDGQSSLFYELSRFVEIPSNASVAILEWTERIQWEMIPFGATVPRTYTVGVRESVSTTIQPLFTRTLEPGTRGDTRFVDHRVDLLTLNAAWRGQRIEIVFHQEIPETFTGPAQFDLDAVRLSYDEPPPLAAGRAEDVEAREAKSALRFALTRDQYARRRSEAMRAIAATEPVDSASQWGAPPTPAPVEAIEAESFDVFFGTDPQALDFLGTTTTPRWRLPRLENLTTYYWRIDTRNSCGTRTGRLWSFRTNDECPVPPPAVAVRPLDGAVDRPLDTRLLWSDGGAVEGDPTLLTFDEVPFGTPADGLVIGEATFGFTSFDAAVSSGPGTTEFVDDPSIEGDIDGTLTIDFATAMASVSFGFALSSELPQRDAVTLMLLDDESNVLETLTAAAQDTGFGFAEGTISASSQVGIRSAVVSFSHPDAPRFAVDNLRYAPLEEDIPCPRFYRVFFGADPEALTFLCAAEGENACDTGPLDGSTTYYWQVVTGDCCGTTDGPVWSFTTKGPPDNDNCATPTEIVRLPFQEMLPDTNLATTELGDPALSCGDPDHPAQSNSVWYRYVPTRDGLLTIDTDGTDYRANVAVFSGECDNLFELACDDGRPARPRGMPTPARVEDLPVTAGVPLLIELTQRGQPGGGTLALFVDECPFPAVPSAPMPDDGAIDQPLDSILTFNGALPPRPCNVTNSSFETGDFAGWTALTGAGFESTPWTVATSGSGFFENGFPREGTFFAQNGFDGDAGVTYDLYQEVLIPQGATSAVLEWSERIQWNILSVARQARIYRVTLEAADGSDPLAVLFDMTLEPGSSGDTGYVDHAVDLLNVAPEIAGSIARIRWHQLVPDAFTGPAQFDIDRIRLVCGGIIAPPPDDGPFRFLSGTGSFGPNRFSLVELRTNPPTEVRIGSTGFHPGLDFSPDGVLYGAGSTLSIIDPADGSTQEIGLIVDSRRNELLVDSISFHPDGTLYAVAIDMLYTIDPATAAATRVGRIDDFVWGIEFAPDGTLFGAQFDLFVLDPSTGAILEHRGVLDADLFLSVVDIDFAPDGFLYGVDSFDSVLYRIDPLDAQVTDIGAYDSELWSVATQIIAPQPLVASPSSNNDEQTTVDASTLAVWQNVAAGSRQRFALDQAKRAETASRTGAAHAAVTGPCTTTFDVFLDTVNPPIQQVCRSATGAACQPARLQPESTYYWQAVARNCCGVTPGPIWSFTTGPEPVPGVLATAPADGFVDSLDETGGLDQVTFRFDKPVVSADGAPLDASAFVVVSTDDPATPGSPTVPEVAGVTVTSLPCLVDPCPVDVLVTLSQAIPPGEWTTITAHVALPGGEATRISLRIGHLPCDVDGDGAVTIRDATAYGDEFNGQRRLERIDIDRSGNINVRDATRFGALWRGEGTQRAWRGATLPVP